MSYPLFKVHIDVEGALANIREVLDSGYIAEGIQVAEFAEKMSEIVETENVTMLNSCTSALTLAMRLADVGPGDEVVTTSQTCLASNSPIVTLGAKPVWADINYRTGMIDPREVEKKITDKTKAVVCVDWAGIPADLSLLSTICRRKGIKLIQDAAHAFGARYRNQDISAWSDYSCYSFQAIKTVTVGDGGMLVCKDDNDHKRAMNLKWFGIDRNVSRDEKGRWRGQAWDIDVPEAGYKFHMNNISAAIGLSQMRHIRGLLWAHVRNAGLYNELLKGEELITPLEVPLGSEPTYWVYTILTDVSVDRDIVLEALNKNHGIGAALVHVPNHTYTCFKDSRATLPETEYFHQRQISLPCGWWLKPDDVKYIAKSLIDCCERYKV